MAGLLSSSRPSDREHYPQTSFACAPAPSGKLVVNADQTVIIIWDAANNTQHFIRKASFKSEADDFGFLIPRRRNRSWPSRTTVRLPPCRS